MPRRFKDLPEMCEVPSSIRFDYTGQIFGKLKCLGMSKLSTKQTRWVCKCECGFYSIPFGFSLKSGDSKSCGCVSAKKSVERFSAEDAHIHKKKLSENSTVATHRLSKHPLYRVWGDMRSRCNSPSNPFYYRYGGRGISFDPSWESFETFYKDMLPTYKKGLQLDRKDNDKGYSKENCRWSTSKTQQRNRSDNIVVNTPDGEMLLVEASEKYSLTPGCITYRIKAGWDIENIFYKQSQRKSKNAVST